MEKVSIRFGFDYKHLVNRTNPAYVLVLIDQSQATGEPFGGKQGSVAEALATAVNRLLQKLIIKCAKDTSIWRCFGVSIIGYGQHTGPALRGGLTGKAFVWVDELYMNPTRIERVIKKVSDGAGGIVETEVYMPIWLDPIA